MLYNVKKMCIKSSSLQGGSGWVFGVGLLWGFGVSLLWSVFSGHSFGIFPENLYLCEL